MATILTDLDEIYDPDLYLPIRGMVYRIPSPTVSEADRLAELIWKKKLHPQVMHEEIIKILGPAHDQMVEDELPAPFRNHAGRTAIIHFAVDVDMGRQFWLFDHLTEVIDIDVLIERLMSQDDAAPVAEAVADGD
ncbi:hypothetical protein HYG77_04745 [Rhodococcus sp. ZPP]|jgi:hypothetical protein|uniref:DUF7426 family protein n=1 Tax=unclassified Rhodococcus (in: high G+C Gram-positive bacteria) TaxID=192944 RepID=UPI001AD8692A|nr:MULTISPECIES: hypothetical protein [unclassified Rhodococcus (in: high G+C Gram-positive bacteria)]QTJ64973.1 hypothetical protein HYG77_04745 [Rhodococcus sp. ZPP]